MATSYRLTLEQGGSRLDLFVATGLPDLTRSRAKKLIEEGCVRVNGRLAKPSLRLRSGDTVDVTVPEPEPSELVPQPIPLAIVYEDEDLLVIDKPPGMPVHPGPGHGRDTLANAVLAHCPDLAGIGGAIRPGIVHRLDKDTSGLIIVAKNDASHQSLSRQLKGRQVVKRYLALVRGRVAQEEGAVDAPVGRDPRNRKRMAVALTGRPARTEFRVLQRFERHTLVEARPITGRTHQIRVHFASMGHPIVGDRTYGGGSPSLGRPFLHASELRFHHPRTGAPVQFHAGLPAELAGALERLSAIDTGKGLPL